MVARVRDTEVDAAVHERAAAVEGVVAADAVLAVQAVVAEFAPHRVGTRSTDQGVVPIGPEDLVVAGAAVDHVGPAATHQEVVAGTTVDNFAVFGAAEDGVVAGIAVQCVKAATSSHVPSVDVVVAGTAEHRVVPAVGVQGVVADPTVDGVVAGAREPTGRAVAVDEVVATTAADEVVPTVREDGVRA